MSYEQIVASALEADAYKSITSYFSAGEEPTDAFFLKVAALAPPPDDLQDKVNRFFMQQELPWRMQSSHWDSLDETHVFLFRGVDVTEVFALHTEPL